MSEARKRLLRNTAAQLRIKGQIGELAVATARDLAFRLPRDLTAKVERELADGVLEKRWADAVEAAKDLGEDATLGALSDVITQLIADVAKTAGAFADELEARRQGAIGRANGIEETLAALDEPPTP